MSIVAALLVAATGLAARSAQLAMRNRAAARLLPIRNQAAGRDVAAPHWFVVAVERAGAAGRSRPALWWRRLLLTVACAATVGTLFATVLVGALLGIGLCAAVGAGLWVLRDRGAQLYQESLPGVLEDLAGQLRSGSSLMQALEATCAPLAASSAMLPTTDLAVLLERCKRGGTLAEQLAHWHSKRPWPGVALAVTALGVATAIGGNQASALDAVAITIRERTQVRREQHSLATQARASAAVMVVVPLVFAVMAASIDPRVGHVLLATPLGLACLVLGLLLDIGAAAWMARITGLRT